mgnify:CR=1 FL=1
MQLIVRLIVIELTVRLIVIELVVRFVMEWVLFHLFGMFFRV